ncbi:MAG: excinuclease ABC subunit UvrC [Bacteroidales bacterium]
MSSKKAKLSIKERVKLLPKLPGVYRFYNKEGVIIYIGKAKNLRSRVSQYFQSQKGLNRKTRVMVSKIERFEHTVVESEEDALLLENNLIKEYMPRYNVMLKDGKTYPWISIKNEPFPRIFITRKIIKDGSLYFGPYSSSWQAHSLVEFVTSIYYIRDCKLSLTKEAIKNKNYRPCLKYHIGKCKAPCISLFSEEEYEKQIAGIVSILKGESKSLIKEFQEKMYEASSKLLFEEAKKYKDKIDLITNHNSKSIIVSQSISNIDIFTLVFNHNSGYGNFLRVVNGSIIQSLNLEFKMPIEESEESIMTRFITEIHNKAGNSSKEILVSHYPDIDTLKQKCRIPKRGDKLYLLKLSSKNALLFQKERQKQEETLRPQEHKERVMESMKKDLGLESYPSHIECFDNSNIQGEFAVAACVVFKNGVPSKKEYRHFNIKTVVGANDYASMKEVVTRRYSRVLNQEGELPQLIVIDGGKGQLSFAWEALKELGLEKKIKLIGIAERLEKLIIPGDPHPLFLDKNSITLRVIMHLRNEAHRFGITHHRNKRSKAQIASELRTIPGIGEKSEHKLLRAFGSTAAIKKAPLEELVKVVGQKAATSIQNHFGTTAPK